jgi:hypothetical protein
MTMHLDLWENHYVLQGPDGEATFASIAQADSAWSSLRALRLLPLDRLRSQQEYRVRIMVHVQPLAAEDQARISRYVSQRSGSDRDEFALDIGGLFRRLVRKDGGESREIHFESAWFRINDLEVKP